MSDQSLSKHFLVPSSPAVHLAEEDKKYLESKGVFTMPGPATCDSLLRAYFHHVHPIMPILEPDVILEHHRTGRLPENNVLIFWCIFFVASNVSIALVAEISAQLTTFRSLFLPRYTSRKGTDRAKR